MVSINIPRESTVTSDPSWPKPPHIIRNCCLHKIGLNQMVSNIACIRVRDGKLQKYFCTSSWFFCKMSWVWCWGREVYDCNVTQDFIETKWCFTKQQWVFCLWHGIKNLQRIFAAERWDMSAKVLQSLRHCPNCVSNVPSNSSTSGCLTGNTHGQPANQPQRPAPLLHIKIHSTKL